MAFQDNAFQNDTIFTQPGFQVTVTPPTPNRGLMFIDVESGARYWRLNSTTPFLIRLT